MKITKFQLIFTGIFASAIIIGVLVFAFSRGGSGNNAINLYLWGTVDLTTFNSIKDNLSLPKDVVLNIDYRQINKETFDQDFIEAIASGAGPDAVLLPHDHILRHADKFIVVPYSTFSERTFKDTFIEGAEIFLNSKGVFATPIFVDPLVMYWNRTLFTNAGISTPPTIWEQMFSLVPKLTEKEGTLVIKKSGIAMGEFENITNAKAILSSLIMQAGSPITLRDPSTDRVTSVLSNKFNLPIIPAESAINFYTEFSNPTKQFYSWNRSLQPSQDFFASGDLAMYFGFASELGLLKTKNPNLNFDVAMLPQVTDSQIDLTYARMVGLAIPKSSLNASGAFSFAEILMDQNNAQIVSNIIGVPPLRRDLLSQTPADAFGAIFYQSALMSRAWYEPEPKEVNNVFKNLLESITSGRSRTSDAVSRANNELSRLLEKYNFTNR